MQLRWGALLVIAACLAPVSLNAAVAPWYERVRQFNAVMQTADDAAEKLAPELIDRIERADDGTYRFWAGQCFVPLTLDALPPKEPAMPGSPIRYQTTLGDADCE